ncbi:unnamed protein product [Ambrosiozyma monospora]|uniref:Unnamed protein product n=1 Tax=Ambrosiozyma monospora TaxID=43982 RepID=A0ACB5SYL0_AMBMO|nr:unnamed protein product [Ambrosiozyma monospora]
MAFEKLQLDQSMMKAEVDFENDDVAKMMESVLFSKENEEKANGGEDPDGDAKDEDGFKYENPDAVTAVIAATEEEAAVITEITAAEKEVLVDEHGRPKRRSAATRKLTDAEIYGLSDQELEGDGENDPEFNVSSVNMEEGSSNDVTVVSKRTRSKSPSAPNGTDANGKPKRQRKPRKTKAAKALEDAQAQAKAQAQAQVQTPYDMGLALAQSDVKGSSPEQQQYLQSNRPMPGQQLPNFTSNVPIVPSPLVIPDGIIPSTNNMVNTLIGPQIPTPYMNAHPNPNALKQAWTNTVTATSAAAAAAMRVAGSLSVVSRTAGNAGDVQAAGAADAAANAIASGVSNTAHTLRSMYFAKQANQQLAAVNANGSASSTANGTAPIVTANGSAPVPDVNGSNKVITDIDSKPVSKAVVPARPTTKNEKENKKTKKLTLNSQITKFFSPIKEVITGSSPAIEVKSGSKSPTPKSKSKHFVSEDKIISISDKDKKIDEKSTASSGATVTDGSGKRGKKADEPIVVEID